MTTERVEPKVSKSSLESETPSLQIIVYVCPTDGCGNHYASQNFRPDMVDIERMQYARSQTDGSVHQSHPRVECPDCRVHRGIHVNRVPYVVTGVVPLKKALEEVKNEKPEEAKSE